MSWSGTWIPSSTLHQDSVDMTWHDKKKLQNKSLISKNLQELRFCSAFSIRSSINGLPKWSMITKISGCSFNNSVALWNWCLQWGFQGNLHTRSIEDSWRWWGVAHIHNQSMLQHLISYHYHAHFHYQFHVHDQFYHHVIHHISIKKIYIYIINAIHASNWSVCNTSVCHFLRFQRTFTAFSESTQPGVSVQGTGWAACQSSGCNPDVGPGNIWVPNTVPSGKLT